MTLKRKGCFLVRETSFFNVFKEQEGQAYFTSKVKE